MIYPENCIDKLGFLEIKAHIKSFCMSAMGQEMVDKMQVMSQYDQIHKFLNQTHEFKSIIQHDTPLQIGTFFDVKTLVSKIKVEGSYLVEEELFKIHQSLQTAFQVIMYFDERAELYPYLMALLEHLPIEKNILQKIDLILDAKGKVRPNASKLLLEISDEIAKNERDVRKKMDAIFKHAIAQNWVADGSLTIRDGRMCIPILAENKRKIKGFVHDESSTGQTVFLEPEEVFSMNNRLRDLEFDKRREIIRILIELTTALRPYIPLMLSYHGFLTKLDFVRAKALFAIQIEANMPVFVAKSHINLINARHPLLHLSLQAEKKSVVPLNLKIDETDRILLVSGPNAGGKSVTMKTVGLLQMMLQAGLLIPADEHSEMGIFQQIFADIGDDQSIESDLSTYSAHLTKMKYFLTFANAKSLVLIDEFGTGTDPQFGGPMAEAVLESLNDKNIRGVMTTHYSNLKLFAGNTPGLSNASMLFDNAKMKPLYILEIGKPGSSYAFEIAQNIGLQKEVLLNAKSKTGADQSKIDALLVDLEREKKTVREQKSALAHQQNQVKQLLESNLKTKEELEKQQKILIKEAKLEAQSIIKNANKLVENTIAEIREKQAEKISTKQLRQNLQQEMEKNSVKETVKPLKITPELEEIQPNDWVKMIESETIAQVMSINKNNLILAMGDLRTVVNKNKVQKVSHKQAKKSMTFTGRSIALDADFKTEIDVRGMRTENALQEVEKQMDKALVLGYLSLRIVHGKGDGILRKMIREYLKKYSHVNRIEDEHADRGGDGISYVYFN